MLILLTTTSNDNSSDWQRIQGDQSLQNGLNIRITYSILEQ